MTSDAHVIDGRGYAEGLYEQVADAVDRLAERDVRPGLAFARWTSCAHRSTPTPTSSATRKCSTTG